MPAWPEPGSEHAQEGRTNPLLEQLAPLLFPESTKRASVRALPEPVTFERCPGSLASGRNSFHRSTRSVFSDHYPNTPKRSVAPQKLTWWSRPRPSRRYLKTPPILLFADPSELRNAQHNQASPFAIRPRRYPSRWWDGRS